jgi:Regulator of chromosome condensation (RCC1) repeat
MARSGTMDHATRAIAGPGTMVGERAESGSVVLTCAIVGLACVILAGIARSQSVIAWGSNSFGQCNVPALPVGLTYVEVAAGYGHTVARRSDGSVVAWGTNFDGQCNVPVLPVGLTYVEVAAGPYHTVARRSDGSVVAWGYNYSGECNVPALPPGITYVEIAAGSGHTVARRSDGSVWDSFLQYSAPILPPGLTYVEIAAGSHAVARRSDGAVFAWGENSSGQCNVLALPPGLTYVGIAAGFSHTVARRSNGSGIAWGWNAHGQCNVPPLPSGLTYVEIGAGDLHTVARRSDGSVLAWGDNSSGQCSVPALPSGMIYVEIAGGGAHTVARYGLSAAVAAVGAGCGGVGMPVFGCNAPRIGQNLNFTLAQVTPNASGSLFYSGVPPAPTVLGSGCIVELDLATFAAFTSVVASPVGSWTASFGVPYDPSLVGLQFALQIALFGTTGPLGFDLSNGLITTVGY